ncbi:MAG: hypothetical protein AB7U39_20305, partial [Ilumatobacteraceae bacterium]
MRAELLLCSVHFLAEPGPNHVGLQPGSDCKRVHDGDRRVPADEAQRPLERPARVGRTVEADHRR